MPFRTKLKRALGGSFDTSSLSKTDSKNSKKEKTKYPDNVYKPGEPMPRPKYRGPWNQAHQDKLSAFSFGSISSMGRRRSSAQASDYSPMGSKLPSRGPSRRGSAWSAFSGGSGKKRGVGSKRQTYRGEGVEEAEGDDDTANVGLSRQHTAEHFPATAPTTNDGTEMDGLQMSKTVTKTNGYPNRDGADLELESQKTLTNGVPFTADELAQAMSQSTIKSRHVAIG